MALRKCDDCGYGVSERAPACPHCGAPGVAVKLRSRAYAATLAAILLASTASAWLSFSALDAATEANRTADAAWAAAMRTNSGIGDVCRHLGIEPPAMCRN